MLYPQGNEVKFNKLTCYLSLVHVQPMRPPVLKGCNNLKLQTRNLFKYIDVKNNICFSKVFFIIYICKDLANNYSYLWEWASKGTCIMMYLYRSIALGLLYGAGK